MKLLLEGDPGNTLATAAVAMAEAVAQLYASQQGGEAGLEKNLAEASARLSEQAKQNLQAPWLAFTAFFTFAIMLSLLVFIFEGVRDAFDPRKTFE